MLDDTEPADTQTPASLVSSPTAPAARAGDAPQVGLHAGVNHGQMIGQLFEAVQRHSGAPLSAEYIERQLQGYLPIGNESDAQRILQENQVLVLFADRSGSGRWTAALQLLAGYQKLLKVRRIRRDSGDSFSMEGLRGHKRTGWILDLRAEDESLPAQCDLAAELHDVDALRTDESYLIVVMSKAIRTQSGIDLDELALTPEPPNGIELFAKCLTEAKAPLAEALAKEPRFTTDLLQLPPGRIVAWARTVAAAAIGYQAAVGRPLTPTDDDFTKVAAAAGSAVDGWLEELVTWHSAAGRTSYERNYLLLTAVFEGEAIPEVHKKVASLASALGEKGERAARLAGQQGPGLFELARQINATLLPDGRIRYPGPGYAEAVVRYFWRDRPDLNHAFTAWTAELCKELGKAEGIRLATRMIPWIQHHLQSTRSTRLLQRVVADWSADGDLAPIAHTLLVGAALLPQVDRLTLDAIDTWLDKGDTPASLLQTLARTCQSLAPAHPTRMLRRLGVLADSTADGVADAVGNAVNALWSDEDLRPRLHTTLVSWLDSPHESLRDAAASAFLNLAQQEFEGVPALLYEPGTPAAPWVVTGWRTVLEALDPSPLAHRAGQAWLNSAATVPGSQEQILATLVSAVHDTPTDYLRGQRVMNLTRLAERWLLLSTVVDEAGRSALRLSLGARLQEADPHYVHPQ
ncbi:hypothetical protein [Kitasatospora sp. SUK 42]|uniref:hypothetical protein n=1 Tax=Kitasatospora sp. SUK 42 TaxID=1588882 RepID=UPI0018C97F50|nr:hypothetical protein [Kitasatospora sp. SUK 42]MBV2151274.1 hypothetical protein [Kitasatospora sp. SUK 42]